MKIYTRTGDDGTTGLFQQGRVLKNDPILEVLGGLDQFNCSIGLLAAEDLTDEELARLQLIQSQLFDVGAGLASPIDSNTFHMAFDNLSPGDIEHSIDEMNSDLPPLKQFILPGGTRAAALSHQCRTDCRTAERKIVGLMTERYSEETDRFQPLLKWINRLSDFFFVMARHLNYRVNEKDITWTSSTGK